MLYMPPKVRLFMINFQPTQKNSVEDVDKFFQYATANDGAIPYKHTVTRLSDGALHLFVPESPAIASVPAPAPASACSPSAAPASAAQTTCVNTILN
jgi:hypothetical protein